MGDIGTERREVEFEPLRDVPRRQSEPSEPSRAPAPQQPEPAPASP